MNHERQHRQRGWAQARWAALLAAGGAFVACSAGSAEPTGSVAQPIAGGVTDVSHHSVFLLIAHHNDRESMCTATLLAPNLLLTARHCVSPGSGEDVLCGDAVLGEPYPASAFFATNDPQPRDGSPFFRAIDVKVPQQGGDTCGYDIALITLEENVPPTLAAPAVPRIDREVVPGESYTAVGYGVDETGQSTGTRMERTGLNVDCQPGSCGNGVESTEFRGETGICSGDSGGPALDSDGKVVGVVSRGGPDCGTPIYGTVTAWRDFIVDTAKQAARLGGYEPAFWVTTGLSDPPVLAGMAGAGSTGPRAAEGEPCQGSDGCETGLICYSTSGEPGDATCTAECTATADCSDGLVCNSTGLTSVCIPPSGGGDDQGGCSTAPRSRGSDAWLALGLVAFGFAARRRRR